MISSVIAPALLMAISFAIAIHRTIYMGRNSVSIALSPFSYLDILDKPRYFFVKPPPLAHPMSLIIT